MIDSSNDATLLTDDRKRSPHAVGIDGPIIHLLPIETVRSIAVLGVTTIHSCNALLIIFPGRAEGPGSLYLTQLLKFATIAFFLISGYLLGLRGSHYTPTHYLARRAWRLFPPWIAWVSIYLICRMVSNNNHHRTLLTTADAWNVVFGTSYWFIPNLFLGVAVLLTLGRKMKPWLLGALVTVLLLIYTVNIYVGWMPSRHTEAFGGFIFYLWLGTWMHDHRLALIDLLKRIPSVIFLISTAILYFFAFVESGVHGAGGLEVGMNTLKVSNQLYSLSVVALLSSLSVRGSLRRSFSVFGGRSFGVYLSHPVILLFLIYLTIHYTQSEPLLDIPVAGTLIATAALTLVSLGLSFGIVSIVERFRNLAWLVSGTSYRQRAPRYLAPSTDWSTRIPEPPTP